MLKAVRAQSCNTYVLTYGHRSPPKGSLTRECSAPQLLPVSPLMLEWSWKQHKHKRDRREVNWWEEAKVKKGGWGDGETTMQKRRGMEMDEHRTARRGCFCGILFWGAAGGGTLHMSILLILKAMSTWLAVGWKRQIKSKWFLILLQLDIAMKTSFP